MKGRVLKISRWAMTQVDLKTPWQARRAAKKLLVKPVSQPSDRLGRQNARGKESATDAKRMPLRRQYSQIARPPREMAPRCLGHPAR